MRDEDEQKNEIYLPLTFTVVLKRKQEMLYVPLDFVFHLRVDALVGPIGYVSAIAQSELDTIKQKAPKKSQNRRPSQISNTSNKWPVKEPVNNSPA